jgi:hypothetical protein
LNGGGEVDCRKRRTQKEREGSSRPRPSGSKDPEAAASSASSAAAEIVAAVVVVVVVAVIKVPTQETTRPRGGTRYDEDQESSTIVEA